MMRPRKQPWAYINGSWTERQQDLAVPVDDIGFLVGATVSDRLRTFGGRVFRLPEHVLRFQHSLEIVGFADASLAEQMRRAVEEFPVRNRNAIDADDDWSISAFATPGTFATDAPTLCIHGQPLPFEAWHEQYEAGVAVRISSVRQVPSDCWPRELKCRSRMHYYLADQQAAAEEAGARAILLDENGFLVEASTANVVIYRTGEGLVTPRQETVLPGISLAMVGDLAAALELPLVSRDLTPDDLLAADEAMLTSTSICMLPIVRCDGVPIGNGRPGEVFGRLLTAWSAAVGIDIAQQAHRWAQEAKGS